MVLDLRLMKIGSLGRFPLFLPVREGEISSRTMELNRTVDGVIFFTVDSPTLYIRCGPIVQSFQPDRPVKLE